MKKVLNLGLFIAFSIVFLNDIKSQMYEPLVIEDAHWVSKRNNGSGTFFFGYVIKGDTIIEEESYKKLYYRKFIGETASTLEPPYEYSEEYIAGVLREDTITRKVYCRLADDTTTALVNCPVGEEFLLYDFSLQVGDTLNTCVVPLPDFVPFDIDIIYSSNAWGKERKHFESYGGGGIAFIMEGVGGNKGLFYFENFATTGGGSGAELLDYCVGTDEECSHIITNVNDLSSTDIQLSISPNPAFTVLNISSNRLSEFLYYSIYNLSGQCLKQGNIQDSISITNIPNGTYFMKITTQNGDYSFYKFIKS